MDKELAKLLPEPLSQGPTPLHGREGTVVGVLHGSTWMGLDAATSRPKAGPIDIGFEPGCPLQYADLDGDGEPEIVALGPGVGGSPQSLTAFSIATGRPLWSAAVRARFQKPYGRADVPDWPSWSISTVMAASEILAAPTPAHCRRLDGYRGLSPSRWGDRTDSMESTRCIQTPTPRKHRSPGRRTRSRWRRHARPGERLDL